MLPGIPFHKVKGFGYGIVKAGLPDGQIKAGKKELFIVDDRMGIPTYTWDFALAICKFIRTGPYGLYNQVCLGDADRITMTKEFLSNLGLSDTVKINSVDSDHFKDEYFVPRPQSEKLLNSKLDACNMNYMRDWKVCLKEYSETFKEDYYK